VPGVLAAAGRRGSYRISPADLGGCGSSSGAYVRSRPLPGRGKKQASRTVVKAADEGNTMESTAVLGTVRDTRDFH
jgi:hypothetical protein